MVDVIALLFASGVGFGLSCWIFGILLDKSNNFGDYTGGCGEYRAYPDFRVNDDNLSRSSYSEFIARYSKNIDNGRGPSGSELVRRLTPEELQNYSMSSGVPRDAQVADLVGEPLSESLKGIFKPLEDEDKNGF